MNDMRCLQSISVMRVAGLALALTAGLALSGCGEGVAQTRPGAGAPPTVTVAHPVTRTLSDYDEYVGRFTAVNSVEVRARVSGYLESVDFKDGQFVKQGDLLFTIDKRSFENAAAQARANLTLAKSNQTFTQSDLKRAQELVQQKTIAEQVFEQRSQAFRNAQAAVNGAEAAVKQADLDLQFTQLRAPIDGRIGDRRVSPGNLVTGGTQGNTTLLATIVSTDPIHFEFTFDEASFLRYERMSKDGEKDVASRGGGVPVSLKLIDEDKFAHEGRMDFVDNMIDRSTGTIRGRALFKNPNGVFTPGMFARIRVPASPPYQALLVPDAAIGTEQARKYVLTVKPDNTVAMAYVTLGQLAAGDLRAIKEGLKPDDRVIVNGMLRARPGQKVTPQEQTPAQAKTK